MRYVLLLLQCLYFAGALASVPVPVFVLHSYSQEYPWTKGQHQGFVQALSSDTSRTYAVNAEYLDTKRTGYNPAYADLTAQYLREKYKGYRPAAVYVTDDNALLFALSHLDQVFPDVPVFFSGINNYEIKPQLNPARVTGVFEKKEIAPNLRLMHRIDPAVRDIVIVGDASETYRAIENEIRKEMTHYPEFRATYLSENRIDDLVRLLKEREERFVFLTTLGAVKDREGRNLTLAETIGAVVNSGRFVVFSMEDAYLHPGVLGGYVTSGPRQGQVVARLLKSYLNGTPISALPPIEASPNEYIVNEPELLKDGLTLPKDIEVTLVNTVPTFYETNRSVILGTLYGLTSLLLISLTASLLLYVRKNRQVAVVKESLNQAQRIAQMGNWDWQIPENRLFWSEGIYKLFAIEPSEFGASYESFMERVHPEDRLLVNESVRQALESGVPYDIDHRIVRPGGETLFVHETAEIVRDAQGQPLRMIGTVQDVTERKRAEQALREKDAYLEHIAYHDTLTGLPNRTLLIDRLTHAASRADRAGKLVALLFIDLDRFKTINDSLGHVVGDALLQSAAMRLKTLVREEDTVSRFGGDEFMILLEDVRDAKDTAAVAEKIIHALGQVFVIEGHHLHVSGSIGISLYPLDGQDAETLMKNADAAMYKAKEGGRNGFHFYEQDITDRVTHRMQMESKLRTAFEQEALEVFYQPLVRLESRLICGAEALLRWNDPLEGAVPPDQFIALAEETGLINPMGEWVIRQACLALKRWDEQGIRLDGFAMHINISGRQLLQKHFPQRTQDILCETGVSPDRIVLELTESTVMESQGAGQDMLMALRGVGISIAIDDFGTGHSSLSRLKQLPISELKIDRSFISDISEDADDRAIVQAILALAASLGLRVVAEGVEHVGQEAFLLQNGCELAQGYYYARPMPENEMLHLLLEEQSFTTRTHRASAAK